ncbi:MAG TPA: NUDIX domain-containing protein [Candidatus Paceibacterota bacterium]|nr:NUDIX domain-containing protein [Candidatus Paceibacterota bacterium]
MAFYNKIGLLVLNEDATKFLVCEKSPQNVTADYIMPGGQFQEMSVEECLKNEIDEELNCEVDFTSLKFIAEYIDVAAGKPDKDVSIKLYVAKLIGIPTPSTEIKFLHWIGKNDQKNMRVSQIIRNKIIPDLINRKILK